MHFFNLNYQELFNDKETLWIWIELKVSLKIKNNAKNNDENNAKIYK